MDFMKSNYGAQLDAEQQERFLLGHQQEVKDAFLELGSEVGNLAFAQYGEELAGDNEEKNWRKVLRALYHDNENQRELITKRLREYLMRHATDEAMRDHDSHDCPNCTWCEECQADVKHCGCYPAQMSSFAPV